MRAHCDWDISRKQVPLGQTPGNTAGGVPRCHNIDWRMAAERFFISVGSGVAAVTGLYGYFYLTGRVSGAAFVIVGGIGSGLLVGLPILCMFAFRGIPAIAEYVRRRRLEAIEAKGRKIAARSLGAHGAAGLDCDTAIGIGRHYRTVRRRGGSVVELRHWAR